MKIQKLKQAYFGDVAARYDANRAGAKWRAEQEAVREFLGRIRETLGGYSLVDIPVGTGRFLEFYREFDVAATGLDVSGDMLAEAGKKAAALGYPVKLELGNILDLEDKAGGFDVALCIRLSNWLDADCLAQALGPPGGSSCSACGSIRRPNGPCRARWSSGCGNGSAASRGTRSRFTAKSPSRTLLPPRAWRCVPNGKSNAAPRAAATLSIGWKK